MYRSIFMGVLSIVCLAGCGGSGKKKVAAAPVRGVVLVSGKPVAEGKITLGVPGEAPVILPIKDGLFEGNALVGINHVEIRAFKDGPPLSTDPSRARTKVNFLPERFGGLSKLTAEVTPTGNKEMKFELPAK